MNFKSKFVYSMSYSISCQPFLSLSLNRVYPFVYIYVLLVSRLKSDNVWSFNALSVPLMPSFHYIPHSFIWASLCMMYIYFSVTAIYHVMITTRLDLGGD